VYEYFFAQFNDTDQQLQEVSTSIFGFRRRDEDDPINAYRHGDQCEGVGLGYILTSAVAKIVSILEF
jgi:hypothetical protein